MSLLADLAIRSSVVLSAGLMLTWLLRRRSAALRHCVLTCTIAGCIAVLPLRLVVPAVGVPLPVRASIASVSAAPPTASVASEPQMASAAPEPAAGGGRTRWAVATWAAGCAWSLAVLLVGMARVRRIARRAQAVDDRRSLSIAERIVDARGIRQPVALLETGAPDVVATTGVIRHRVLLPRQAREWPDSRLHAVLAHELAHVERHDWVVQIAGEIVRAILWFNPLAWIACRRLGREAEHACDDLVIAGEMPARAYAEELLAIAKQCRSSRSRWAAAAPMAHPSSLERRITAMLNPTLDRRPPSRRLVTASIVMVAALAGAAAALRAQAGPTTLSGSIYDQTGGALPGVSLTLEASDGTRWTATSAATGRFDFAGIAAGPYTLSAAMPGFKSLKQQFDLRTPRDWDRAITLPIGDLSESISVRETRMAPPPLPSQPTMPAPVRIGGNIKVPRKLVDVRPVYPVSMRTAGREGVVKIDAVIGKDGTVTMARVLSTDIHPDFAIAAIDAVRQWKFSPTLLNGAPVDVVMTVSVAFNLGN